MNKLTISQKGTLLSYTVNKKNVIYPYHENKHSRGGAFWCLPNFDEPLYSFSIRHGEYRNTEGIFENETYLKNISGEWGSLSTKSVWKRSETGIQIEMTLTSLSDETLIRPGFHPYFPTEQGMEITLENENLDLSTLEENRKHIFLCNEKTSKKIARLKYEKSTTTLTFAIKLPENYDQTKKIHSAFCVWTDAKDNYLCIEPVLGGKEDTSHLPSPFILNKDESITFTIFIENSFFYK